MRICTPCHRLPALIVPFAAVALILSTAASPRAASGSATTILARAIANTNSVRTLRHYDKIVRTAKYGTISIAIVGQEDEVHNRERDVETVRLSARQHNGKTVSSGYKIAVIFANGHTFVRGLTPPTTWSIRKGMQFLDQESGVGFNRSRTTVPTYPLVKPISIRSAPAGTQVRARVLHQSQGTTLRGTIQLLIKGGLTPYVIQETVRGTVRDNKGKVLVEREDNRYGPFNTPLQIQPPVVGSSSST